MSFKGRESCRSEILMDNKIIEQINSFNYFGNLISKEKVVDIDNKLNKNTKITGIINYTHRPKKTLRKIRIKLWCTSPPRFVMR
jgi:hypothetical protein